MSTKTGGISLLLAAAILVGCGGSKPDAKAPSASDVARAEARAVVETAETVWLTEAQACVDSQNAGLISVCDSVLTPIRDVIIEAGGAVDTWTDADRGNLPCMMADIKNAVVGVHGMLGIAAPKSQVYADLLVLFNAVNTTCVSPDGGDAGAKQSSVL